MKLIFVRLSRQSLPETRLTDLIENLDFDSIIRVNEEFEAIDELSITDSNTHRLFQHKFAEWFEEHVEYPDQREIWEETESLMVGIVGKCPGKYARYLTD